MRTSTTILYMISGSLTFLLYAGPIKTIAVQMQTGMQPVYGALYYVQSHAAQRVGEIKRIDDTQFFNVPVVSTKARRYLIVSYKPQLLKEVFIHPLTTADIALIPLPGLQKNVYPVLALQPDQLERLQTIIIS